MSWRISTGAGTRRAAVVRQRGESEGSQRGGPVSTSGRSRRAQSKRGVRGPPRLSSVTAVGRARRLGGLRAGPAAVGMPLASVCCTLVSVCKYPLVLYGSGAAEAGPMLSHLSQLAPLRVRLLLFFVLRRRGTYVCVAVLSSVSDGTYAGVTFSSGPAVGVFVHGTFRFCSVGVLCGKPASPSDDGGWCAERVTCVCVYILRTARF